MYIFPDGKGSVCNEAKLLLEYCLMGVNDVFGLFKKKYSCDGERILILSSSSSACSSGQFFLICGIVLAVVAVAV